MEIQAYLNRIGFEGEHVPTLENLRRVIRSHVEHVPFENLDCCYNPTELSVQPEVLYDKVVTRNRGGVCFELNGLLHWALEQLGYEHYPVSVRISRPGVELAPITHQGNVAVIDGQKYYCDVGFGGPGPKGALCVTDTEVQNIGGELFRAETDGFHVKIYRCDDNQWSLILRYVDTPSSAEDFSFLLYFFCMHPQSYFVTQRLVNLTLPNGSLALTNNTYTRRENGEMIRRELTEEEVPLVLKEEFGLVL